MLHHADVFDIAAMAGKLHEAVHAFEAVVLKEKEHSEAWRMLGMCHAENDEDKKAILCLERAVEEDPYNLDAQVALGVSYVNELKYDKALAALKSWITHNPKFHGLKVSGPEEVDDAYGAPDSKLDDVMHLMLKATAWDSTDPEVQVRPKRLGHHQCFVIAHRVRARVCVCVCAADCAGRAIQRVA